MALVWEPLRTVWCNPNAAFACQSDWHVQAERILAGLVAVDVLQGVQHRGQHWLFSHMVAKLQMPCLAPSSMQMAPRLAAGGGTDWGAVGAVQAEAVALLPLR